MAKTIQHYRRPAERPFTVEEREKVTILVGGLTRKHEELIQAVFQGSGYRCELLPVPDQSAFLLGKEFGNNGQCSPCYFTSGALIKYLRSLEAAGMSRQEIVDGYLYFTAGSCGPCRFSTYAAEYRMALQSAGFDGFRVLRFQQDDGIHQKVSAPGLKYTIDFGLGMLKVLFIGDVMNDLTHGVRAYEVNPGETNRVMAECMKDFCDHLRTYKAPELVDAAPRVFRPALRRYDMLRHISSIFYKMHMHLKGPEFMAVMARCRKRIDSIALDRTKLKPVVKVVGEFWAQTTEGGGNYRMFDFLEKEGAHVQPEAIGTWLAYLMAHARMQLYPKRGMNAECEEPGRWALGQRFRNELNFQKRRLMLSLGEKFYTWLYHRVVRDMGGVAHRLVPQEELAECARPFFKPLARGGEGYLEVGKNIYYHSRKLTHMVLGLKPFGCLPSSQSDGIQSAVVGKHKDMIYLPIETSGEGEVNAHSRVQMALGEAKAKAKDELQAALASTGKTLEQVRDFVTKHPELNRPLYHVPHHPETAGVAANLVFHVSDLMAQR
ncbi:MAG: activator of (R)-2-hydroxyglutaryl-CoA dehydratase [Acidobacteriota bacterium]|jgi:predicted nucleotide-binding protein (sugar kinase/HSP70/actin superfamily)|nr:activator of (R)-2-hydroxyglutaryl-CoA dehydratase [Acidobacteriota bacterium]